MGIEVVKYILEHLVLNLVALLVEYHQARLVAYGGGM